MMGFLSTKQVARRIGVDISTLSRSIWLEKFQPPQKGPGGNFLWTDGDIERAAKYFNRQPAAVA